MKEKNLREILEKCTKEELIKTITRASKLTYATFPWMEIISEIRLNEVEAKINANLAKGKELSRKFSEMAANQHNYTNDEVLEIRIAIAKNHEEWKRLDGNYDKFFKELHG